MTTILWERYGPMHSRLLQFSLIWIVLTGSAVGALAQGGGKAEPLRIEFKPGSSSTVVSDSIKNDQQAEYVLGARKGQRLTIKLTSVPRRSAVFDLTAPDNADLGLEYDANYEFNKILPVTGDYLIVVVRPTSSHGKASYKLSINIH